MILRIGRTDAELGTMLAIGGAKARLRIISTTASITFRSSGFRRCRSPIRKPRDHWRDDVR
jgi:hypothetical protein